MNKEYTYIDGKVILKDDLGNVKQIEYYDNLNDILIQENLIETMQNRINQLEKSNLEYKKCNKKFIPFVFIIGLISSLIIPTILLYLFGGISAITTIIDTIYGPLNLNLILTCSMNSLTIPIFIGIESINYYSYKQDIKKGMSIYSELNFLKKQINIESKKLLDLKSNIQEKPLKPGLEIKIINDSKVIETLQSNAKLYRDCGYNGKKYYKYLQKGILSKKLVDKYTTAEIEKIEKYLEEKGPQLVKKK